MVNSNSSVSTGADEKFVAAWGMAIACGSRIILLSIRCVHRLNINIC